MHCPGCGAEAPVTQRFCRSCGFCLEKVPHLVAEQLSESEEILTGDAAEKLQERQQKIERWLSITGFGFHCANGTQRPQWAHLSFVCGEPSHCAGNCAPDINSCWFRSRFACDVFRESEKDVVW